MKYESFPADGSLIRALMTRSQSVASGEGGTLFYQGEAPKGLFILEQGEVVLVMLSDAGRAIMCVEAGPGSVLGLSGVIANRPFTMTALIRKGSRASFVTREEFEKTLQEEPELYTSVLRVLAADYRSVQEAIAES
ncbi:MAG TPA: Crp/Fnr family transcriptional regulator [Terracidiphilus sp.]|nr:Crp/Fnr family transcriptional regulator [Terracidiphilus sp.]